MRTLMMAATFMLLAQTPAPPAALPDTPQGRHVAAWVKAVNGSTEAFLAAHREHMAPAMVEKRTDAERTQMHNRLRGDFSPLTVQKIVTASAKRIQFTAPARDEGLGTFTFEFEDKAPFRIASLAIDVTGPK